MRVITVSDDKTVLSELELLKKNTSFQFDYYTGSRNSLDVISFLFLKQQGYAIIDNDFLKNDTVKVISLLKQLNDQLNILFITSDNSVALGREICPLGVLLYLIKPFEYGTLKEALISFNKVGTQLTD